MLVLASAIAAFVPMSTYLLFIWYFDFYDREPFGFVLQNYFWGALGAIVFSFIGSFLLTGLLSNVTTSAAQLNYLGLIIVAPVIEETVKGIFLFLMVIQRKFDNVTDGLVYGGAVGLGFGMTENFLYFLSYSGNINDWMFIVIVRTFFSAVMHCIATATFGAFVGLAKYKETRSKILLITTGLITAILIHFLWNFSLGFQTTAYLGFVFMGITVVLFSVVFASSVMSERKIIFTELTEEAELGTIPSIHIDTLSSLKRNQKGWINESIRKNYIRSATTLAFRKLQLKNMSIDKRLPYENDITEQRKIIAGLLTADSDKK